MRELKKSARDGENNGGYCAKIVEGLVRIITNDAYVYTRADPTRCAS